MGVEIDGSFGRLDVDLVVEAMNMLGLWKSRVTLMGRLCRSGMISGTVSGVQLVVVLARDDVSPSGVGFLFSNALGARR